MNEYRRFVQAELDRRNWRAADVVKHGGPSRQVIHTILNDKRDVLDQRPKQETIEGLSRAFNVPVDAVLARVAMAMGLPLTMATAELDSASDEDLLEEIRKRMQRESGHDEHTEHSPEQLPDNVREGRFRASRKEQKIPDGIAAYDRELGDGFQPGTIPED